MRHRGEVLAGTRRRERGCADGGQDGTSKGREDGMSKCLGGGDHRRRGGRNKREPDESTSEEAKRRAEGAPRAAPLTEIRAAGSHRRGHGTGTGVDTTHGALLSGVLRGVVQQGAP